MQEASKRIIEELSRRGYRITKTREEVCGILAVAKMPLSIQEVVERAASDEASVYRTIHTLRKERLVEEVSIDQEKPKFELNLHHHHHAVCRNCGFIAHLPCGPEPQAPRTVKGFAKLYEHELTFYGLCTTCC